MSSAAPLVSVVMPCYNNRATLPTALASLLCQSYENWECILIDDGSADRPEEVVEQVRDPRIRFERMSKNWGQGVVRQRALEVMRGEFMCGLDADDWLFPTKVEHQLAVFEDLPEIGVVTTGISLVDEKNELVGVRSRGPGGDQMSVHGPFGRLLLPIPSAPSMIRTEIVRGARYDPTLRTTQDMDFFLQFLPGRQYGWLPEASYVYTEQQSVTRPKILLSLHNTRRVLRKHRAKHPVLSRMEAGRTVGKEVIYRAAYALGLGDWIVARRASLPRPADVNEFTTARAAVERMRARMFVGL